MAEEKQSSPEQQQESHAAPEQPVLQRDRERDRERRPPSAGRDRSAPASAPPGKGSGGLFSLLLALIALGVAGYASYQVYLGLNRFGAVEQRLDAVEAVAGGGGQRLREVAEAQRELAARQERSAADLTAQVGGLRDEIVARSGTSSQDWILAEAEYLIRLANQRVLIEREVKGAVSLLQAADSLIRDAELVSAAAVRQALAEDIARLKAVGSVDTAGLFLRLGALAGQVDQLPQRQLRFAGAPAADAPGEGAAAATGSGWRDRLGSLVAAAGERLGRLVDFRRGLERIEPILPPREEYYLRQNLRLQLEIAQLALLKGSQAAYDQSLADSSEWVRAHFDGNDPATVAMQAELAALSAQRIQRELPDISASLAAMRGYMSGFHRAPDKGDAPDSGTTP